MEDTSTSKTPSNNLVKYNKQSARKRALFPVENIATSDEAADMGTAPLLSSPECGSPISSTSKSMSKISLNFDEIENIEIPDFDYEENTIFAEGNSPRRNSIMVNAISPGRFYRHNLSSNNTRRAEIHYIPRRKLFVRNKKAKTRNDLERKKCFPLFSGVTHGICKPKHKIFSKNAKVRSTTESNHKQKDAHRKTGSSGKSLKPAWEYKVTDKYSRISLSNDDSNARKRKFFKTTVSSSYELTKGEHVQPESPKKKVLKMSPHLHDCFDDMSLQDTELFFDDADIMDDKVQNGEIDNIINKLLNEDVSFDGSSGDIRREDCGILDELPWDGSANKSYISNNQSLILPLTPPASDSKLELMDVSKTTPIVEISELRFVDTADTQNCCTVEETPAPTVRYYDIFKTPSTMLTPSSLKKPTSSAGSVKKRDKFRKVAEDDSQYQLDVGQKNLCEVECAHCGMVYSKGSLNDEKRHEKFHSAVDILKYKAWKTEKVVGDCGFDKIILVTSEDIKTKKEKVFDVIKLTENEIGCSTSVPQTWQAYLYVRSNMIVGCALIEPINTAQRLLTCSGGVQTCAEVTYPVKCGINRLWVKLEYRKQGVATHLLNCLRKNYVYGDILDVNDVAFSATTADGNSFARKYVGRGDYLVYSIGSESLDIRK